MAREETRQPRVGDIREVKLSDTFEKFVISSIKPINGGGYEYLRIKRLPGNISDVVSVKDNYLADKNLARFVGRVSLLRLIREKLKAFELFLIR